MVRFAPMSAPPFGDMSCSVTWFAVPMRLLNGKFKKFITGYYQDTAGSSQFLKRPNMMFDFSKLTQRFDLFTSYYDVNRFRRYNLFDYLGIRFNIPAGEQFPATTLKVETARILAFWYIYFEYFVDQNLGYRPNLHFFKDAKEFRIRLEDGTIVTVPSIMNWEQFTQLCIFPTNNYPASGGRLTIGDCIEHGLDIDMAAFVNNYPENLELIMSVPDKCWPKDYFTSALPWAQKGNPVTVPISSTNAMLDLVPSTGHEGASVFEDGTGNPVRGTKYLGTDQYGYLAAMNMSTGAVEDRVGINNFVGVKATGKLDGVSFTINDLRSSYALQTWLERNARCGSRYVEQILSHFGVRSSDARLQRPEYLGGFRVPVHVASVAQTSEDGTTPQGNLAGNAVAAGTGKPITYFCEEHMLILGLMYVQPKAYYYQGMSRLLTRREFYDFYFPEFQHLGEQQIHNYEIYNDGSETSKEDFGYQSRYSEYKFMNNGIYGDFLHDSLRSWLFGVRTFGEQPTLSPEFLQVSPAREPSLLNPWPVVKDDSPDKLYCQVDISINSLRPIDKYGTPYL